MRIIIFCCDDTGNEISENISNVLKLYRCLRKTEKTQPRRAAACRIAAPFQATAGSASRSAVICKYSDAGSTSG